jgi:cold-inducible RNA-binding protein
VAKKLYVGNLTYGMTDGDLQRVFEAHGTVESVQIIMDRDTGRSKGFGFVEMGSDQEAQAAIQALNGQEVNGRALTVNEARPREDRGGGGHRGGGGRGGFGGKRY